MTKILQSVNTASDSFGDVITKLNAIVDEFGNSVVTVGGNTAIGNTSIEGTIFANTISLSEIAGSSLSISSNTITFSAGANVIFDSSASFSNNVLFESIEKVKLGGANSTNFILTANSNTNQLEFSSFSDLGLINIDEISNGILAKSANSFTVISDNSTTWNTTASSVNLGKVKWDAAYSWGNHASAGYLTSSSTLNSLSNVTGTASNNSVLVFSSNNWSPVTLDSLSYAKTSTSIATSNTSGLTGGGDLSTTRNLSVSFATPAETQTGTLTTKSVNPYGLNSAFVAKTASIAQANTGTDNSVFMTPLTVKQAIVNGTGLSSTKTTSGSMTLPGGLIAKWGLVTTSGISVSVTYDTAFPNATLHVQLTPAGTTSGAYYAPAVILDSLTKYGFDLAKVTQNSAYWFAIGY